MFYLFFSCPKCPGFSAGAPGSGDCTSFRERYLKVSASYELSTRLELWDAERLTGAALFISVEVGGLYYVCLSESHTALDPSRCVM
jgi:hypothetical protein